MMRWKTERVFNNGDLYFDELIASWSKAKRTLFFEVYIFEAGYIASSLESALIQARARGVDVRLLVDGMGAAAWLKSSAPQRLIEAKIQIRVFNPFLTLQLLKTLFRGLIPPLDVLKPAFKARRNPFIRRLNRRNHRKLSVIDGHTAYVGSINVSDEHMALIHGPKAWRDTAVEITGSAVSLLEDSFMYHWRRSFSIPFHASVRIPFHFRKYHIPADDDLPVGFTHRFRLRLRHRSRVVSTIEAQVQRIWIANPYLAPPSSIVRRLVRAAQRGVDVRILIPSTSDVWFMPIIARAYYRSLLKGGVRIFEYTPRFLHSKVIIFDDRALVGSSNLNRRSFLHDSEVDVWLSDPDTIDTLVQDYHQDLDECLEITTPPGWFASRIGWLLNYLFRYWV